MFGYIGSATISCRLIESCIATHTVSETTLKACTYLVAQEGGRADLVVAGPGDGQAVVGGVDYHGSTRRAG